MASTFVCGFECGTAVNNVGGDGHIESLGAGTSVSTSVVRTGLRSIRVNPSAQAGAANLIVSASNPVAMVWRYYLRIASHPDVSSAVGIIQTDSGGNLAYGLGYNASTGLYYPCHDDGGTVVFGASGVSLSLDTWHLIDVRVDASANPWTIDVQVNGTPLTQLTRSVAAGNVSLRLRAGNVFRSTTADYYVDDLLVSETSGDYPLGGGSVEGFVPNADGTHTFTTTIGVRGTTAAPTGGGNIASSSDSYEWLNGRPIGGGASDNTRLWNQQSNGSTLYGEVQFENAGRAPRAVEVLVLLRDAATGTGDRTAKLNDNGTEDTIYASGVVAGITSDYAKTKHYTTAPSTGAAWTQPLFDGLRFRFGYSADANPDHYCRGVMIEAEFPPAAPGGFVPFPRPRGLYGGMDSMSGGMH